ncbi:hypothetical protein KSP40_PGU004593 [Platanthera guangdongensis]|uniref:Maturase K n=1 Tax=Platanthera guangdongensis TaxID=2320717 RepID=A0ABR2M8K7_9ASPA
MLGKISYLSDTELYKINPHLGYSLSLPGGWPLPHTLQNFVHYSRESCVKQNCLYLEFLGSQCASYSLSRNEPPILDLVQANQMLSFAGNWTAEQATESDLDIYIGLFKWYHIKLQPYCCFFESFYIILEEKDHPIWKCIRDCRKEFLDHHKRNIVMLLIPLLSPKLAKISISSSRQKFQSLVRYESEKF